ncbi:MAG: class E sortase [Actinobacteria bacterium]|nr:MAG: class E sortase [Actinomycetota bacterium]
MKKKLIRLTAPIIIILIGLGLFIYPKVSYLKYNLAQSSLKAETKNSSDKSKGIDLPKDAVAKIAIPKIDLEAYVLEGTTQNVLAKGPGHYEETPMPGQVGNSAIAGHRTMHGHPFRDLNNWKKTTK